MAESDKDLYLAWLNDAHAMELGLAEVLEKQVKDAEGYAELQSKLREHIDVTRRHADLVATCIKRNGSSVSATKDFIVKAAANFNALGMRMMEDTLVKNVHSSYAAEQFEIATYTILQTAAEQFNDEETEAICTDILDDEIDMANWLLDYLPQAVEFVMQKKRAQAKA